MGLSKYQLSECTWPLRSHSPRSEHFPKSLQPETLGRASEDNLTSSTPTPTPHPTELKTRAVFRTGLQFAAHLSVSMLPRSLYGKLRRCQWRDTHMGKGERHVCVLR